MNKYNLKVGDRYRRVYDDTTYTITRIAGNTVYMLNDSGGLAERSLNIFTLIGFFDEGTRVLIEDTKNMEEVIEVGDIVGYKNTKEDGTSTEVVKEIKGEQVFYVAGGYDYMKDLKVVSKANKQEIIGYELLKDLPGIPAGTKSSEKSSTSYVFTKGANILGIPHKQLEDTTWFKPIYKPKEVRVELSNGRYAIIKDKIYADIYLADKTKATINNNEVGDIVEWLSRDHKVSKWKVEVKEFHLGCQVFTRVDLANIHSAFVNFK